MRAIVLALVVVLAGCSSGEPPTINPPVPPTGYDCSGDQPTDPCIIQPEPTYLLPPTSPP